MVATPRFVPGQHGDPLAARLSALEKKIAAIANKTLYSASIGSGGITIDGTGGIEVNPAAGGLGQFYVGGGSSVSRHADGSPQIITSIGDELGRDRLTLYDEGAPAVQGNQRIHEWDVNGVLVRSQDINGGWATPWFDVHLYPLFTMGANSYYGYMNLATTTSGFAQGGTLWEGRIPFVSHPRIALDGVWGQASGTVVPTYTLTIGSGGTAITGTWTPASLVTASEGPFDISTLIGETQVPVTLSVTWTGSGSIAAQLLACYLRQT